MGLKTIFSRVLTIFGLTMLLAVSGWGVILDSDTFDTTADGWSGTNVTWNAGSGGQLFMNRNQAASKTFSFGAGYAGADVDITLTTTEIGGWENGDVTQITANGTQVYNSNVAGNISFSTTLNGSGQLAISVMPSTNANAEDLYMDNFIINYTPIPEINLQYSGTSITDGDAMPSIAKGTDFSNTLAAGGTVDKTFTIQNTGTGTLTIGAFTVTGDFSLQTSPAASVAAGSSTTFTIRFDPTAIGIRNGTVSFINNDSNENPYNFSITGIGDGPPTMGDVPNQTATTGTAFSLNIASYVTLTNSDPILEYNLTGALPAGLSFNNSTGAISGTPTTVAAAVTLSVTATDNDGVSNSDSFTITVNAPTADLLLTMTAPATTTTNNTIQYDITVKNNGPSTGGNITVTDILPASLTYQNSYGPNWVCSYVTSNRTLSCVHPTDLLNGDSASITIVTVAPSTAQNVINSASISSSAVGDSNSANNTTSSATIVSASSTSSNNERDFTLQKQYNINGNIKIIGNSMLLKSDGTCANSSTDNNDISTTWADKDGDGTTWNSTSADLVLPKGVNSSKIKYAGLYWQGRVDSSSDTAAFWVAAKTIKFKAQGLSYQTLTSADSKYNWTLRSSRDSNYQGAFDVTAIIKQSIDTVSAATIDSTGFSGTFWGANIQAQKMTNGFGAWALVVVYEDYTDTLKNISLYDGYTSVDDGEIIPTTLSGFLTPTSGAVESNFLVFGGEGDITLTDSVTLTDRNGVDQTLGSNIFNSSEEINGVAVTNRNPNCANTIGIDIDSFSVGSTSSTTKIIGNSQTSTIVKLKSTGDVYYPGVFAFSTQLYIPDVCYLESVSFNNLPITSSNIPQTGDNVEYTVEITNKNSEPAKGVFVEKVFDKPDEISYISNSMSVAPIPGTIYSSKSDVIGDDTAEFNFDTNTSKFLLGSGAAWYGGGTIVKNDLTKFKYGAEIGDQNASENTYLVSYRNDLMNITFSGIPIRKCSDFNNSFSVVASGEFQIVEPGLGCGGEMHTKVVGQDYPVDVISCNASNVLTSTSSLQTINVTYSDALKNPISGSPAVANISFPAGQNRVSGVVMPAYAKAVKSINLSTKKSADVPWGSISNNFAVRPKNFIINTDAVGKIKAGTNFNLRFYGRNALNIDSLDYNDTAGTSFDVTIGEKKGAPCVSGILTPTLNSGWSFSDGNSTISTNYSEAGQIDINISENAKPCESRFAAVDCDDSDSAGWTKNGDLSIEPATAIFDFTPDHFTLSFALQNSGNGFTYISSDLNMSAKINLTVTAENDSNATTTNYQTGCYAKNTNYAITYDAPFPSNGLTLLRFNETLTDANGSVSPIGTQLSLNNLAEAQLFTAALPGVANPIIRFNFDKNSSVPVSPVFFNVTDLNVSDVDNITGTTSVDANTTFIYGRTHAARQRYSGTTGEANIYYEAYCFGADCVKSRLPNGAASTNSDDIRWFINQNHNTATNGNIIGLVTEINGLSKVTATAATAANPSKTTLTYDATKGYPYKTTMENGASSWLIYNPDNPSATKNQFSIGFENGGAEWGGAHKTKATTKSDKAATKTNRRTNW